MRSCWYEAKCFVAVTVTVLCATPNLFAAEAVSGTKDTNSVVQLEERTVTATRTALKDFDTPYVVNRVTSRDIEERQLARTVPEALKETPAVMVQKTANGQGSPYIRGFTGFRTLMLVDGIRLNNSVFREGPNQYWNTIDPLSVQRLEIVKGPGSVLYGSDAIGGTVNAITSGRSTYGEGFQWDRGAYYRFSSAEGSHIGRGEISGSVDKDFGFQLGYSMKDFGDLRAGGDTGRQHKTGYNEWDGDFKGEYFLTPDSRLVFAHQRVDQDDIWRTHRTIYGESFAGTTIGTDLKNIYDQDRTLSYVQYHAEKLNGPVEAIHASLSWQEQSEDNFRQRDNLRIERQGFDVGTAGVSLQLESPSPIGRWTYGVEYYHDKVNSVAKKFTSTGVLTSKEIQGPVADDAGYDLMGLFAQDSIPLGERFELLLGGRFNYAAAEADRVRDPVTGLRTTLSQDWEDAVGSGRLLYRVDEEEHWHLFTGASQGFRAPNLSDLTRFDIARSGEIEVPSLDLKPEQYISTEFGAKAQYRNFNAQVAYFRTEISDMIVRTPNGQVIDGNTVVTKRNSGDGYIHGVELQTSWEFMPQFSVLGWFTWMKGELDQYPTATSGKVTEPLSRVMPITGQLALRWDSPHKTFWTEAVTTIAGRQDELSSDDLRDTQRIPPDGTPGYIVYTLRSGVRFTPYATLTAALENITDKDYRIHGSGVNEAGRNMVVSFTARF